MKKIIITLIVSVVSALAMVEICSAENTYRLQVITKDVVPGLGEYTDAQYFECPESSSFQGCINDKLPTVEAEKAKRIANYVQAVKNPPTPIEPSKEELLEAKASLEAQMVDLDARIAVAPSKPKVVEEAVIG